MPQDALAPHEVTRAAVDGDAKGVALRLGKCLSYIYKMAETPGDDRYTRFLQLYLAVGQEGRDLYFQDFQARHYAEKYSHELKDIEWSDAIGDVAKEFAEAITAAVKNKSKVEVVKEVTEAIRSLELLLEIARAGEAESLVENQV